MKKEEVRQVSHASDNSCGVASVVLGINAIVFASVIGLILAVVGLFFGLKQNKIAKNKWSRWGIILTVIAIILSILIIILNVWFVKNLNYNI